MVKPRRLGALMALMPIAIAILLLSTLQLSLASFPEKDSDAEEYMIRLFERNADNGSPTPEEQKWFHEVDDYYDGADFQDDFKTFMEARRELQSSPIVEHRTGLSFKALQTEDEFKSTTDFFVNKTQVLLQIQYMRSQLEASLPYKKYLRKSGPKLDKMIQECRRTEAVVQAFILRWVPELRTKLFQADIDKDVMQQLWFKLPETFGLSDAGASAGADGTPKASGSVRADRLAKMVGSSKAGGSSGMLEPPKIAG